MWRCTHHRRAHVPPHGDGQPELDARGQPWRTENISFVYSLQESCRLNDLSFGDYIEDICERMMRGEKDFESLPPCDYKNSKSAGPEQAVA